MDTATKDWLEKLVSIRPSKNQYEWQKLEFTAFFHYGINTYTNREWGNGKEDISVVDPQALNTDQWCEGLKAAGIRACIITAKHHDGFCLWDTAYTDHSIMHTPCKRDIVAELSESCKKYDIKFGVYLSPWDMHEATYGQGVPYDDYFCNQLTELLTKYGEVYTVWFDGACGEGPNGKKQVYDWDRYYALIRKLQPNAVISVSGPDVRWCGNEAGDCRESEWSVVPARLFSQKAIAEASQQSDDEAFREKKISPMDRDLGGRKTIEGVQDFIWYPAEVDTSIRPGWFHHPEEDDRVRPLEKLTDIYVKSVGGNSVLLLNIPPHKDGYLTDADMTRLKEIGAFIQANFGKTVDCEITATASYEEEGYAVANVLADNETSWKGEDFAETAEFTLTLSEETEIGYVALKEQILEGQRVERFRLVADGETVFEGTTIGYQKFCNLVGRKVKELKVVFDEFRKAPVMNCVLLYSAVK